ncbi:MAG TPA: efflux RND transporter permease subunit, partial [Anaeromyxobacteraceae bacterium]|nr:efflux RND transporter permease subunit [Anaeromyxobacteraceae bacterium]
FDEGLDLYRVRQLVTERLQLASPRLPATARAPQLAPIAAPIGALLKFAVTAGAGEASPGELRTFADWTLTPRLLAIAGVSQVIVLGGDVERVEIHPDPVRMRDAGVRIEDLLASVRASQAIEGAGFVERGAARLDVAHQARLTLADAPRELAAAGIAVRGGTPLRVGDVAAVVRGHEPRFGASLYDGRPAVYVQVSKLPWADTRSVTARVERALADLAGALPQGARLEPPVFRQVDFIDASIWSVERAMLIGSVLVTAILVAFLRRARLAVISLAAIPLSLLAALAVLVAAGASVNAMTLGGLAIAAGEVVDDAIVDVENVWRRLRENARLAQPRPALAVVHDASVEVRGAVVYATFIVGVVLVPVLVLGGIAGRIFSPLAQAYVLAVLASLAVALTVTPALCAWLLPRVATPEARLPRPSTWLLERYRRTLRWTIARPRAVLVGAGAATLAAAVTLPFLSGRFLPEFHENAVIGHLNAIPGTSLEETTRLASRADGQLRPEVAEHVAARIGRAELGEDSLGVNQAELDVLLRPDERREWDDVVADVARRLGRVPGVGIAVEGFLGERVNEILSGQTSPIVVNVLGPDLGQLRVLAARVTRVMEATPGVGLVRPDPQTDVPQLEIRPDRAALAKLGVTERQFVDDVVRFRQGAVATQILGRDGRLVDVLVAGGPAARDALGDIPIDAGGAPVALSALADVDVVAAPAIVHHDGGDRRIGIGADTRGAGLSRAVDRLERRLAQEVKLPQGYRLEVTGQAAARSEAVLQLLVTGLLVLLGVFVLLAVAFRSVRDAAIVLVNLPLGLVGGVAAATLYADGVSVAGFVGFVTLFGIIARNGIMLVAHMRQLETEAPGADPVELVLRAAEERLLPIVMTAAAAGLALLPLALSMGARGSELEAPMAVIVVGGLVSSTSLNMLVLPTLYAWLARRRARAVTPP